jgi:hypothetical protein
MKAWVGLGLQGGGDYLQFKSFRINVHHHRDHPEKVWLLSSPELFGYQLAPLKSETLEEAKTEALGIVHRYLADAKKEVEEAMNTRMIGFWGSPAQTSEGTQEVKKAGGTLTNEEATAVLAFIEASKVSASWRGYAGCRVLGCNDLLGTHDMVTPDEGFIFPDKYEHYIIQHGVRPPEDFIQAALAWQKGKS